VTQNRIANKSPAVTARAVRTYEDILNNRDDPNAKRARLAIDTLTTKHEIPVFEIQARVFTFVAYEHFGTGRLWKERFTISRTRAKRLARRLRTDAEDLRKALAPQFKFVIGYRSPLSAEAICDLISRAAVLIEGSLEQTNDRNADWTLEPKRELTQFVWRATGKPLDRELSDLISAILGLDHYTAEEQRKFHERSCKLSADPAPPPLTPSRRRNRTTTK